jgi:hypothetical protein
MTTLPVPAAWIGTLQRRARRGRYGGLSAVREGGVRDARDPREFGPHRALLSPCR